MLAGVSQCAQHALGLAHTPVLMHRRVDAGSPACASPGHTAPRRDAAPVYGEQPCGGIQVYCALRTCSQSAICVFNWPTCLMRPLRTSTACVGERVCYTVRESARNCGIGRGGISPALLDTLCAGAPWWLWGWAHSHGRARRFSMNALNGNSSSSHPWSVVTAPRQYVMRLGQAVTRCGLSCGPPGIDVGRAAETK